MERKNTKRVLNRLEKIAMFTVTVCDENYNTLEIIPNLKVGDKFALPKGNKNYRVYVGSCLLSKYYDSTSVDDQACVYNCQYRLKY